MGESDSDRGEMMEYNVLISREQSLTYKKLMKKLIKANFKDFVKDFGFFYRTDTTLLRITDNNVLHIITFSLTYADFTCAIAIQPLYIYEHERTRGITLSLGERISKINNNLPDWWSYEDGEANLKNIKELLLLNGIPFLDRYGTPEGIIDLIKNNKYEEYNIMLTSEELKHSYFGFSLLHTGRIQEGLRYLEEKIVNDKLPEGTDLMWKEYQDDLATILNRIRLSPADTPIILQELVEMNRKALKIKD